MATIKLAEALLRRKELQEKVEQLRAINQRDLYEVRAQRKNVTESVDDIVAQVPLLKLGQVTAAYDYYARRLRLVDAVIQQTNWTADVEVADDVMADYEEPENLSRR